MCWQENCVYETVVPPLDERDFEKTVTPIVQEYFEHADTNEVAVSVQETCQWTGKIITGWEYFWADAW